MDPQDIAHALSHVCRFGGHVRVGYSVAQHCVYVSEIVEAPFALAGLLHDAAQAYVGNVVGPLARLLPEYRAIERRVQHAIADRFGLHPSAFDAPEVRRADAQALLAERAALLPPASHAWAEDLAGVVPAARPVVPVLAPEVRAQFLSRLAALWPGGAP